MGGDGGRENEDENTMDGSCFKTKYMSYVFLWSCALVFVADAVAVTVTVHERLTVDNCPADYASMTWIRSDLVAMIGVDLFSVTMD